MFEVFRNGRSLGIIETNFVWAERYWGGRSTHADRFTLKEIA